MATDGWLTSPPRYLGGYSPPCYLNGYNPPRYLGGYSPVNCGSLVEE